MELSKRTLWQRSLTTLAALMVLIGMAMPAAAPFLAARANAANGATDTRMIFGNPSGNPTVDRAAWDDRKNKTGQDWAKGTLCEAAYVKTVLTDGLVQKALGPLFDNMSQWIGKSDNELDAHFYDIFLHTTARFKDPANSNLGDINETVGMNYVKWIRDHLNQTVNVIIMYNSPGSSLNTNCGNNDAAGAHFVMVPAEGDPNNPFAFIGRQIYIEHKDQGTCPRGNCTPDDSGYGGVLRFAVPQRIDANFTKGELDYYDEGGTYHNNAIITVRGVAQPVSSVVVGAVQNATFQDAAHINVEYVLNGKTFQEQYTDFRWDEVNAYFLSKSSEPARQQLTAEGSGQDTGVNPISNPGGVHMPFIYAFLCPAPGFKSPGFNLSYNDNAQQGTYSDAKALQRVQGGINNLGTCGDLNFYDFDINGSAINPKNGLPTPVKLAVGNTNNARIWFYSNGNNGMVNVFTSGAGNEVVYTGAYAQNTNTSNPTFYDHNAGDCPYLGRTKTKSGAAVNGTSGVIPIDWIFFKNGQKCQPLTGMGTLDVNALIDAALYTQQVQDSTPNPDLSTPAEAQIACDAAKISLSWLICPIAYAAISLAGSFDNAINDMLNISVKSYLDENGTGPGLAFYTAWNSFRVLAMAVIVIASLLMIISQALGFDLLDAYTIRKILPRLLIAVIAIAISWSLMKAAITFSDVLGYGVRNLIYAPFKGLPAAQIGAGTADVLAILGGAAFLGLGAVGLLSFALTALLAVFIGFSLLVFREMVVIFGVILTPLAIALSILPNTRKGWQFWQNTVSGALLMFPIVAGFIAIGHVFAGVAGNVNSGGVIGQFIFIIAYFAPYFLIPVAFRLAGGLVATVGGVVNDRSRGAFDRLKQFRANRVSDNMQKMAEGRRFNETAGNNRFSRGLNRVIGGFNSSTEAGATFAGSESKWGFLTNANTRRAAYEQQRAMNRAKYGQTARAQTQKDNDLMLQAMSFRGEADARTGLYREFGDTYDPNTEAGRRNVETAIAGVKAGGGWSTARSDYAARALGHTGTGYGDLGQMQRTVYRVAQSREQAASLLGELNAVAGNVGRAPDLKPGFATQMDLYDEAVANGGVIAQARLDDAVVQATNDADGVTYIRSKKTAINNSAQSTRRVFERNEVIRDNAASTVAEAQDARDRLDELKGTVEKIEQAYAYGSTTNVGVAGQQLVRPTAGAGTGVFVANPAYVPGGTEPQQIYVQPEGRRRVEMEASPVEIKVNPITDRPEVTYEIRRWRTNQYDPATGALLHAAGSPELDAAGRPQPLYDPETNRPILAQSPTPTAAAERSRERAQTYGANTSNRDPYNQGLI